MSARVRPLTGLDALFLYLEAAGTPMHVASLLRVEPPRGARRFASGLRRVLIERLGALPILRRVLEEAPLQLGHPGWRELPTVDLEAHVRLQRLPGPGDEQALEAAVAACHAEPLDRDRPLWQIVVFEGLADRSVAVYMKSHHALVDGQAGVKLAQAMFDPEAEAATTASSGVATGTASDGSARGASWRSRAGQWGRMIRGMPAGWDRLRAAATPSDWLGTLRESVWLAPRTRFNVALGRQRRLAFCSLPIEPVKRIARRLEVSLNDVVLALVASALRRHLRQARQLPAQPLVAAMPVSLRQAGSEHGNEVSMVQCPLATDIADPLQRLQAIAARTRAIKGRVAAFRELIPTDFPGFAAPLWATGLSRLWQRGRLCERLPPLANLVVSNVPGPPRPLHLAGGRIRHYHPVSIVTHGLGLNITLISYAGSLEFGVVAAKETLPRPAAICRGLEAALAELQARCPA